MERQERAALIFFREHCAGVEGPVDNGHMRSEGDVRHDRLFHQVRLLPLVARIFVWPEIGERPAVESALLDAYEIVRHQIVTQGITFLNGSPEGGCTGVKMNGGGVAGSRCKSLISGAV